MVAIALALGCALVYGSADFLGGLATRRVSALAVVLWSQVAGLGVLALVLPLAHNAPRGADVEWGVACGAAGGFAVLLLYRGLAIGTMGVVSPTTAVLAAAVPVLWAVVHGERPAPLALVGIACALVAVVLVSAETPRPSDADSDAPLARPARRRRFAPGIPEAIGAGTAFGFLFIGLAQTRAEAGFAPMLAMRLTSVSLLLAVAALSRSSLRIARPSVGTVAAAGALDMAANILYILAAHLGALSIVAVIASLYPAGTVALAAIVLHERLVRVQWAGVAIALAGVLCISLAR